MIRRSLILALALTALQPRAQTQTAAPPPAVTAIRATILTVTKGTIANGTIVLRNGKIAAVGADVPIPPGADVVDAAGRFCRRASSTPFAHRGRLDQRGRHHRQLDDRHRGRLRSDRHRHLPRSRRRAHVRQRAARQREPDRRQEPGDQAPLGQAARRRLLLRGRDARDQVRPRRKPEAPGRRRRRRAGAGAAALSGHAHGRRVRDPRCLHARQGVSERLAGVRPAQESRRTDAANLPPGATSTQALVRKSRSASCTRTRIARTGSSC